MEISEYEKNYLFSLARKAIVQYFLTEDKYYHPVNVPEKLNKKMGVFVTLKTNGELRGCIGYPLPEKSIAQAVADNAINAAFHDFRFPPLKKEEVNNLEIEITILTVPEQINYNTPDELLKKIEIGRDGLIIEYGMYGGLLLPQVPVEEKWDKKTYLGYLCRKAGLPQNIWTKMPVTIKAFQGIVLDEKRKG
ncbi:MAG: AmmeMemoRadiSam system protein A [Candidatus Micrarchaeota archaeon]